MPPGWLAPTPLFDAWTGTSGACNAGRAFNVLQVIGYLGYVVNKWRTWLVYCHWVDGKSQKLANIIGSHVTDGSDMATRLALFHIWRYMNLAIFLCYKPMVQRVSS